MDDELLGDRDGSGVRRRAAGEEDLVGGRGTVPDRAAGVCSGKHGAIALVGDGGEIDVRREAPRLGAVAGLRGDQYGDDGCHDESSNDERRAAA